MPSLFCSNLSGTCLHKIKLDSFSPKQLDTMVPTGKATFKVTVCCSSFKEKKVEIKQRQHQLLYFSQGRDSVHIELNISTARKADSAVGTASSKPVFPFDGQVSAPVLVCSTDIEEDNLNASFRIA